MNRRGFLTRLLAGAAGAAIGAELDLERLLWVPKPIITVPAMPTLSAGERLRIDFGGQGFKVGDTISIRMPNLYDPYKFIVTSVVASDEVSIGLAPPDWLDYGKGPNV